MRAAATALQAAAAASGHGGLLTAISAFFIDELSHTLQSAGVYDVSASDSHRILPSVSQSVKDNGCIFEPLCSFCKGRALLRRLK